MDLRTADRGTVTWSDNQGRFELTLYEAGHHLYSWLLPPGFTSPAAECTGPALGIEELNARLADAKVIPSGSNSWTELPDGGWERSIYTTRTSADQI